MQCIKKKAKRKKTFMNAYLKFTFEFLPIMAQNINMSFSFSGVLPDICPSRSQMASSPMKSSMKQFKLIIIVYINSIFLREKDC